MTDTSAWAALLRVHATVLPVLDQELRSRCGLPLTWYDVLLAVNSAPGRRLTMGELGRAAVVSRTRVSRVVGELETAGLVERVVNDDDGRSVVATITAEGRSLLRSSAPFYLEAVDREFTQFLGQDAPVVARALERVLAAH